jgi:hypothetical protein
MAMFGQIPLPQNKDIFEGVMDQWMKQKELRQTQAYQEGLLDIHRQAEKRAQDELPHLITKYEDEHGKAVTESEEEKMKLALQRKHFENIMKSYNEAGTTPQQATAPATMPYKPTGKPSPYKDLIASGKVPPTPRNELYSPSTPTNQINDLPPQDRAQIEAFIASGKATPAQVAAMQQILQGPVHMGAQQNPGPQRQQFSQAGMQNLANLPKFMESNQLPPQELAKVKEFIEQNKAQGQMQGQPQMPEQPGMPVSGQSGMPDQPGAAPQEPLVKVPENKLPGLGSNELEKRFNAGEEVIVKKGNPERYPEDEYAGEFGTAKPIQHIANGVMVTEYPSGKRTVQKVDFAQRGSKNTVEHETPADREAREIRTNEAKLNQEYKHKGEFKNEQTREAEGKKLKERANAAAETADMIKQAKEIFARRKNVTGLGPAVKAGFKLSNDQDLAALSHIFGSLQGQFAKFINPKAGIGTLNLVKGIKPDTKNTQPYNEGMLKSAEKLLMQQYERIAAEYKEATGKDLDVKMPDLSGDSDKVTVFDSHLNKNIEMTKKEARELGVPGV